MKLIIDIPDELFNIFKKHRIMAFDYFNEYDKDTIARIIAHGTTYNPTGDCISREALRKEFGYTDEWYKGRTICETIDNAQAVEITEEQAILKLHETGWLIGHDKEMTTRPKGKWEEGTQGYYCSKCDYYDQSHFEHNFCPNCGADMRKGGAE